MLQLQASGPQTCDITPGRHEGQNLCLSVLTRVLISANINVMKYLLLVFKAPIDGEWGGQSKVFLQIHLRNVKHLV